MSARRIVLAAIIIALIVAGGVAWYLRGPGPFDFAGGSPVKLADYKAPTRPACPRSLRRRA